MNRSILAIEFFILMNFFLRHKLLDYVHKNDLILVTRNTSDFKKFSGLKLENWHVR